MKTKLFALFSFFLTGSNSFAITFPEFTALSQNFVTNFNALSLDAKKEHVRQLCLGNRNALSEFARIPIVGGRKLGESNLCGNVARAPNINIFLALSDGVRGATYYIRAYSRADYVFEGKIPE